MFVDDASGYPSYLTHYIKQKLASHVAVFNQTQKHSERNAYEIIHKHALDPKGVVVNLDGDDWFYDKYALSKIANVYRDKNVWFTYGQCLIWDKGYKELNTYDIYANKSYPEKIIDTLDFRRSPFMCSHPRTWKVWLYKKIRKADFLRPNGSWLEFAEDQAMCYPMLEMSGKHTAVIRDILSVYNIESSMNDHHKNAIAQVWDELIIRRKPKYETIR